MKCSVQITVNKASREFELKPQRFKDLNIALAYVKGATMAAMDEGATSVTVIIVPARLWRGK